HARQVLHRGVNAAARLGHPLDLANDRLAVEIFQLDLELAAARGMFDAGVAADVTLGLQHFEHAGAHLRARGRALGLRTHLRVADAGDEIADRIVRRHLTTLLTSSTSRAREPDPWSRVHAARCGTACSCDSSSADGR